MPSKSRSPRGSSERKDKKQRGSPSNSSGSNSSRGRSQSGSGSNSKERAPRRNFSRKDPDKIPASSKLFVTNIDSKVVVLLSSFPNKNWTKI